MDSTGKSIGFRLISRAKSFIEPELFQPFVLGLLGCLALSEFVRGALTLSMLPIYGKSVLGLAAEWTTLAISIQSAVDNIFRSPVGILIDKWGQRIVLILGFAICTASVFIMMNVHTLVGLLVSAGLYGMGVTPVWPAAISGLGISTPEEKRASFMGYLYMFWLAGMGAGPVLINFLIGRTFHVAFVVLVAVEAAALLLALVLVRKQSLDAKRRAEFIHRQTRRRGYWARVLRNVKSVAFLFPGMFVQTFAVASLIPIMSLYARFVLHVSPVMFSSILVVGGIFTVSLLLPAGKLVDRFGPRTFLVPAFLVAGSGLAVYPLFPTLLSSYIVISVLGLSYAFILPSWNAVLDRSIDPDKKATLWGVFMTVEGIGSSVGPYVGGLVWDTFSPRAPFFVSAGVILLMGFLYLLMPLPLANRESKVPRQKVREGEEQEGRKRTTAGGR